MRRVAALYVERGTVYRQIPFVEFWDADRDARRFPLDCPVVAHPPCQQWSRLRTFAKVDAAQRDLAYTAVGQVRRCGGVLEHPSGSALWRAAGLPLPGCRDRFGAFTFPLPQRWFGHECEKRTWLYVLGVEPQELPAIPFVLGRAVRTVQDQSSRDRVVTPKDLADWLVELARRVR